jgi:long-chain acyl-CoA synthetase
VEERLKCRLVELWGMTEISGVGTTHPFNGPSNLGSIGIPLPFTEVRVAAPEDPTRDLGNDEVGELLVRGPHVMEGYFGHPLDTAKAIEPDGWLHSGDLVRRDQRGYLYLVDRIKDIILSGGYTIYPAEVERVISQHRAVSAALAVAVADLLRGQMVKAYVVLRPGMTCMPEDIISHCRQYLAAYKVPRAIEMVPSLPMGCTGKVLRRQMTVS